MEAIGIAASLIGIGQALLTVRNVVEMLQEIPKIGNELASLKNEIESLRAAVEAAKTQGTISRENEIEGPDLRIAKGQIIDIANKLENVRLKCVQIGHNGKIKPKMARWFWMQKELRQCRDKARDARAALQLALATLNLKSTVQMSLYVERFALRPASHHDSESATDIETDVSQEIFNFPTASASESKSNDDKHHILPRQEVEREAGPLSLLFTNGRPSDEKKLVGMDMVVFRARLSGAGKCPQPCRCRCHNSRPSVAKYPSWIGALIGSLSVTYDHCLLLGGNSECTELGCKGRRRSSATFEYHLPAWVCAQFVSFQVYIDSFRQLRTSLRSVRVVQINHKILLALEKQGVEAVKGSMLAYGRLLPDDRSSAGWDIMLMAITWATPEVLEFMTGLWAEDLRKDTFNPNWVFAANRELKRHGLSDQKAQALRLIASYGEEIVDAPQTELHEAVSPDGPAKNRNGLRSIVSRYPWTVDQLNGEGRTPLTLAVRNGNYNVVRDLVCLGCNVDRPEYDGATPLMVASASGNIDVVQYLLDAGCSVNATSMSGNTAIHYAADPIVEPVEDPGAILQILLSAGASAKTSTIHGDSPLHNMGISGCGKLSRQAAMTKIRLLLEAGADVNAMNYGREQPLERAIFHDQPEVVKCLIEAGARVTNMRRKQNLLHISARLARLKALQYLADMQLPLLHVHQEDDWGDTPWDHFIRVLSCPEWDLGSCRRPTSQERDAFVKLYKKLRGRSLELDISRLQRIRRHLEDGIQNGAMSVLQSLISEKRNWEQWHSLRTYETIMLQVREPMVEAALELIDKNIGILQEKIDASPWHQVSRWDPPKAIPSCEHEIDTEF